MGTKISALPVASTPLSSTDSFPVVQAGATKKAVIGDIPGILVDVTGAVSTSAPNNVTNTVSLTAVATATHSDLALCPKGSGALLVAVPDNTATGGNKRGSQSVDLQRARTTAAQVASGQYSAVLSGYKNTASNTAGLVAGGENNTSSGAYSFIGGGNANAASAQYATIAGGDANSASALGATVGGGSSNTASGINSAIQGGTGATTRGITGAEAYATGSFFSQGLSQRERFVMYRGTTDATPTRLSTGGAAHATTNQPVLPNTSVYAFVGRIAVREAATGDCAAWEVKGVIKRGANAAATSIVGTVTSSSIAADTGASPWSVSITADTTLGCLAITVTGEAAHTLRWVADIETVEVVG